MALFKMKLKSSDNDIIEVDQYFIELSGVLTSIEEYENNEIIFINYSTELINKCIDFSKEVPEEYDNFKDIKEVFDLLKLTNYLDIPILLDILAIKIADLMKSITSPEQVKYIFRIDNTTKEERTKFIQCHSWLNL